MDTARLPPTPVLYYSNSIALQLFFVFLKVGVIFYQLFIYQFAPKRLVNIYTEGVRRPED